MGDPEEPQRELDCFDEPIIIAITSHGDPECASKLTSMIKQAKCPSRLQIELCDLAPAWEVSCSFQFASLAVLELSPEWLRFWRRRVTIRFAQTFSEHESEDMCSFGTSADVGERARV